MLAKERLDKKGAEDNRFRMKHTSEIDDNLFKTSGCYFLVNMLLSFLLSISGGEKEALIICRGLVSPM